MNGSVESYTALYPVNQRIVADEPVVSKHDRTRRIQSSYIEHNQNDFPSGKSDRDVDGFPDDGFASSIEKSKTDGFDRVYAKIVFLDEDRIGEAVRRSGIDKTEKSSGWNEFGGKVGEKGRRLRKSGRVEINTLHSTTGNNAVLGSC
jgi:hypothetical protein